MKKKRASIKDIAEKAGVSIALVSYILNDKHVDRISPSTAKRVKAVAQELEYRPNRIAQSLKKDKTYTIGLIIADISNLFYSTIARFIEDKAGEYRYNVIFGSGHESAEKFNKLVDVFLSRQVDGIILAAPANSQEKILYLKNQGVPFVLVDRMFPEITHINTVMIDNYKASYEVVDHLSSRGFKKPVMITLESDLFHLLERSRGFSEGVIKKLGASRPLIVEIKEENLFTDLQGVLADILKDHPDVDVLYFSTNKIAIEGLAALALLKVEVPSRVGVVCFDEADAYRMFNTSITYVRQPIQSIAFKAVDVLHSKIEGNAAIESTILDVEIVEGASTNKSFK